MSLRERRPGVVSLAELADRLRDTPPIECWNVLTDECFDGRLLRGSRPVPLDQVVRHARAHGLAGDTEIVVYGSEPGCPQAQMAADKLTAAGYANVYTFPGGLATWEGAGYGLESRWPS